MQMRGDMLGYLARMAREHGDIVYLGGGPSGLYLISDPELIQNVLVRDHRNFHKGRALTIAKRLIGEGLVTSEGDFHRRQRRLVQPAFHRQRIAAYGATMVELAARTRARWREGEHIDIAAEMMRLTLAIVGKTLFNTDVEAEAAEIGEAMTDSMHAFEWMLRPYAPFLQKLPFRVPAVRRFDRARKRLDAVIYRLIEEHRAAKDDNGDLLSMLLLAHGEEADGGEMTNDQVRDEAMTLFLAGHETTSNGLTWTWYLLAQHPDVEAKLTAEIESVLEGRLPTSEDVANLPYTRAVFAESMRLYPPVWAVARRALADYSLGEYEVPAGAVVFMSQHVMHRDPRYFPLPDRFMPDRWLTEPETPRPRFAYFPFGGGPRICIGEGFAWMEGILLLATLGQQWRFHLLPNQKVTVEPLLTLRPKNGIAMRLQKR